ncbi:MAG TPA: hypothetical protein VGW39_13855 [Chthoniobacterales bacterium]|nr:hypothetical protein [Chthoniobacterales bacterium]
MTPQANFTILAPIDPTRKAELRLLLDSMNDEPGRVNATNPLIPFAQLDTLHFARFVILDDGTVDEIRVYGVPAPAYPLYLAFLGDIDGEVDAFFHELVRLATNGLRSIFSCCTGFGVGTDLVMWLKQHNAPASAAYVNWRGRTVRCIHEEAALKQALDAYLKANAPALTSLPPRQIQAQLRQFINAEKSSGRLTLSEERATPIGWRIKDLLHLIGVPLLGLLALPLVILIAPIYLICLRRLEKTEPELCWRVDQAYSNRLSDMEDHYVTNQFTLVGSIKPVPFRLWTLIGVLAAVDYAARHIVRRGRLGRIRTIHFARWVFLDRKKRMVFFSNYDGTVDSYMDDFINKAGFGLNALFSNGVGYLKTNWLVLDGCHDEEKYRNFLRRHTLATQVWYKAYPGATAIDLERNTRVRQGLDKSSMSEEEAKEWVALL